MIYKLYLLSFFIVSLLHFLACNVSLNKAQASKSVHTRVSFKIQSVYADSHKDHLKNEKEDTVKLRKKHLLKKVFKNRNEKSKSRQNSPQTPSRVSDFDQFFVVEPEFPYLSRVYGETGKVVILIKTNGKEVLEKSIEKSSGFERLDQAALKAIEGASMKGEKELPETLKASIEFQILED